ncbi:hypothetical protein D623_10006733 [Myotis brandtii]|uniref:Uncharacterized protein n=1 Tax=Myotis brandtii TaxID=109478 RepID=S7MD87_MYOBR|nr:hypothetical protein D623_10006733 [Myotis brandtii]
MFPEGGANLDDGNGLSRQRQDPMVAVKIAKLITFKKVVLVQPEVTPDTELLHANGRSSKRSCFQVTWPINRTPAKRRSSLL